MMLNSQISWKAFSSFNEVNQAILPAHSQHGRVFRSQAKEVLKQGAVDGWYVEWHCLLLVKKLTPCRNLHHNACNTPQIWIWNVSEEGPSASFPLIVHRTTISSS